MSMNRKAFLHLTLGLSAGSSFISSCKPADKSLKGEIIGANSKVGHLLRQSNTSSPTASHYKDVVIIGAGVSGLSAARKLQQDGITDYLLLELEQLPGGNSKCHQNELSSFPMGAHYIPIPNNNLTEYLDFLKEVGIITGMDSNQLPVYNELYLCHEPEERLFINGKWQEGIIPEFGLPDDDKQQITAFLNTMQNFRTRIGKDNKYAFAIPVEHSSLDEEFISLDQITMSNWMKEQGFTSPFLQEYVNYCSRDDFGTKLTDISAWAAIHYFAARKGKGANADHNDVLTWPEGNAYLIAGLLKNCANKVKTQCLVTQVKMEEENIQVIFYNVTADRYELVTCKQCIMAVPQFIAARVLQDPARQEQIKKELQYAPWMVATMLTDKLDEPGGTPVCWDNVIYGNQSLGYVNSTHQLTTSFVRQQNLSFYLPLTEKDPAEERKKAADKTWQDWLQVVLTELSPIHPDLPTKIKEFSVTVWGHAMIQPRTGFIHGKTRADLGKSINNRLHFAHTDLSGISIFEEGFYQGLKAANKVIDYFNSVRS